MFETLSIFSFCCMGNLKLFSLYINIKHWAFIISQMKLLEHEQLDGKLLSYADIAEDYSPEIIAKYTKRYTIVFSILLRLYSVTLVVFVATPFFEYALTAGTGYPHILPGWAPLDDYFLGYILTLIFEVIASVYCVFVHVAFDCASVGIMIFICGQFSLLRRRTEDIAGGGEDCMPNAERDVRAHLRIIESHGTHIVLCTVIKKLDTLLRIILGVYFLVATLTFCAVAVRLSSTLSFMQLVSLLQYMAGSLTQLFLFCRYGDAVFHESSFDMGEGPFGAAWWSLSPRMRRELVMLGAGMIQPRTLHAGPFNQLDLPSFVQVVRTAYSYYAVVGQTK
ncbi:odorant receptor 94b-like [Leguminivora glycinivorella]|uniref:odorant receptor 94b-like n=1 Tax=Leguminivora glycinivorella TaxID=1035111 RepID=UPI0020104131|nr:odorant receptor 94b-like [Leguminivora glycinivorella]